MAATASCSLSDDEMDDLLYLSRIGDTQSFSETLSVLKESLGCSEADILLAARDDNSGNNVLHMACGNGHLGSF